MFYLRPIQENDLSYFIELALDAQLGMTNLPKNPQILKKNIERSLESFTGCPISPYYLFVLQDTESNHLIGIAGILAKEGMCRPLNYFRMSETIPPRLFPEVPSTYPFLQRIQIDKPQTEVCSLFISPVARQMGFGKLLSFSRFLFMKLFPERFSEILFAELRGVIHSNGVCPFWDGLGRHFLPIDFHELMHRRDHGQENIADLIPSFPIFTDLFSEEVKSVIGETHPNTRPALRMLIKQGFTKTFDVDLFDAGPRMEAKMEKIRAIKDAKKRTIHSVLPSLKEPLMLVSNTSLDFRAALSSIQILNEELAIISSDAATVLNIDIGSEIMFLED